MWRRCGGKVARGLCSCLEWTERFGVGACVVSLEGINIRSIRLIKLLPM